MAVCLGTRIDCFCFLFLLLLFIEGEASGTGVGCVCVYVCVCVCVCVGGGGPSWFIVNFTAFFRHRVMCDMNVTAKHHVTV